MLKLDSGEQANWRIGEHVGGAGNVLLGLPQVTDPASTPITSRGAKLFLQMPISLRDVAHPR